MKIIFVCTGNTCRSPMAEYLLQDLLAQEEIDIEVESAGIMASPGSPPTPETEQVLRENGYESISSHQAQHVSELSLSPGDLLLGMTAKHRAFLADKVPEQIEVSTLNEYLDTEVDLSDPFGSDIDTYRRLYQQLKPALEELKKLLREQ